MDLRQLEYFIAVAEERSFTRGANRAHVVQSGVSAAIHKLERELGADLFDRSGQQIRLTEAGEALLPCAHTVLAAVQAARDAVDQVRGGVRGAITVGTMLTTGTVDVPALLGRFHAAHPHVIIRLQHATIGTAGHIGALLEGSLDLALVSLAGRPPAGLNVTPLAAEPLLFIRGTNHPLAGRARLPLADLVDETFIDFPLGWGNRAVVDHAFAAAGLDRQVSFEVTDFATAAGLVRHGVGVTFLPASAAAAFNDLSRGEVEENLIWTVAVATAAGRPLSMAARALLEVLRGV